MPTGSGIVHQVGPSRNMFLTSWQLHVLINSFFAADN